MSTRILVLLALLLPHEVFADEVPTELFGITLGMTATRTQENPAGEMAIKRLTGLVPWSRGARYYYEPEQESEAFPFLDYRAGEEEFYSTNHSSLVLPVIPAEVTNVSEWEEYAAQHGEKFTVLTVEYTSQEYGSTQAAYMVASKLCQDKSTELALEPSRESDTSGSGENEFQRACFFITDNRELEINQNGPKYVYRLKFTDDFIKSADKAVGEKVSEMQLNAETAMNE
jgi:hypothetical protein